VDDGGLSSLVFALGALADVDSGHDKREDKYETIEVFNGVVAYAIKFFVGGMLRLGFKLPRRA